MKKKTKYMIFSVIISALIISLPVFLFQLPRNCDTWFYLSDLSKIDVYSNPLMVFSSELKYDYNPLFYFVADLFFVETPKRAAIFTSFMSTLIPATVYLVSYNITEDYLSSFFATLFTATNCVFLGLENVFKSEVLAVALFFFLVYWTFKENKKIMFVIFPFLVLSHPFPASIYVIFLGIYSIKERKITNLALNSVFLVLLLLYVSTTSLGSRIINLISTINNNISIITIISLIAIFIISIYLIEKLDFSLKDLKKKSGQSIKNFATLPAISYSLLFGGLSYISIFNVPTTEFSFSPLQLLFYLPTILVAIIGIYYLKKDKLKSIFLAIVIFIGIGAIIEGTIPIYRPLGILIPVFAIAASIYFSKKSFNRKKAFFVAILLFALILTAYPSPNFTFGYEVQYYPEEYQGINWLNSTNEKVVYTDVTMGRAIESSTNMTWKWIGELNSETENGIIFLTDTMIKHGARPPVWDKTVQEVSLDEYLDSERYKLINQNERTVTFKIQPK